MQKWTVGFGLEFISVRDLFPGGVQLDLEFTHLLFWFEQDRFLT